MKEKPTFKVFHGSYSKYYGQGACDDYDTVVIAETENVALGLSLEKYSGTVAEHWDFEEIKLDKQQIIEMHNGCV